MTPPGVQARRRLWITLVAVAILAMVGIAINLRPSAPQTDDDGFVVLGRSVVAVERALGDDVYQAPLGPEPVIDTTRLGVLQPIDRTPVPPPAQMGRPAVLVGSNPALDGTQMAEGALFIYQEPSGIVSQFLGIFRRGGGEVWKCLGTESGSTAGTARSSMILPASLAPSPTIPELPSSSYGIPSPRTRL